MEETTNNNTYMSDTYNYTSGSPFDGLSGVLAAMNCGGNGNNRGLGGGIMDIIGLVIVAGLFGGFGNGGGLFGGGRGGNAAGSDIPAATASLVGQQQVADRVSGITTGIDAIAGLVTANANKLNAIGDNVTNGFFANQTNLCQLGSSIAQQFNAQTLQGINNHNNLTSQLTEMRFANQQCCCDTRAQIESKFCNLTHQLERDKGEALRAIAYEGEATRAMIKDIQTQQLQEKLAKAEAQLSQNAQTASIVGAIQANCHPQPHCGCGPVYGCCNPCGVSGAIQRGVDTAIGERIGSILFPTATTAA